MIAVVETSGLSTVQDGGRRGFADVGVPISGAWHRERYLVAVGLLTGDRDESVPAIELLAGVLELRVHARTTLTVVGPAALSVDERLAAVGACIAVHAGERVRVEHRGPGPVYVAVAGWAPESVLGSSATDTFSRLGPAPLHAGWVLTSHTSGGEHRHERVGAFHRELAPPTGPLRVVPTDHPSAQALADARWTVTDVARSGVRLTGPVLTGAGDVPSRPMVPGAVQVTPSGDPVVLGPDGGLTGGYPVVAVVATVDLDRLSLLSPGDTVAFRGCDPDTAAHAHRDRERALASAIAHPGLIG